MEFRKFESLDNTYIKSNISKIVFNGLNKGKWIVTEKLHGANFAVYVKNGQVENFASRNQFVDEEFYASGDLQAKIKNRVAKVSFELAVKDEADFMDNSEKRNKDLLAVINYFNDRSIDIQSNTAEIIFFGELVGDNVQKEIRYSNKPGFFCFDVVVEGSPVNKEIAYLLARLYGFNTVPVLRVGTFEECSKVSNLFNSCLSYRIDNEHFNMCYYKDGLKMYDTLTGKLLEDTSEGYCNEAEGIIIEPVEPMFYHNGKRIYLKNKTQRFSEKNDGVVDIEIKELTEKDNEVFNQLMTFLNENRLNAVMSKGHPERAVPFMLMKDIFEDYYKENEEMDLKKYCDNYKLLTHRLQIEVVKFISSLKVV